jgi:hypothetical protein
MPPARKLNGLTWAAYALPALSLAKGMEQVR